MSILNCNIKIHLHFFFKKKDEKKRRKKNWAKKMGCFLSVIGVAKMDSASTPNFSSWLGDFHEGHGDILSRSSRGSLPYLISWVNRIPSETQPISKNQRMFESEEFTVVLSNVSWLHPVMSKKKRKKTYVRFSEAKKNQLTDAKVSKILIVNWGLEVQSSFPK